MESKPKTGSKSGKASVSLIICLIVIILGGTLSAEIPINRSFICEYKSSYMSGVGWADFDGNGWPDLAVTCGLDAGGAWNLVYYNLEGVLSEDSVWISDDLSPSGNLYIGDLDNNGAQDLIAASLGTSASGFNPTPHIFYLNSGSGLSSTPSWSSVGSNAFSCTAGDPDGDGDLDIVFTEGAGGGSLELQAQMFINNDGVFDTLPGWQSDDAHIYNDAAFADIDRDGDLDLIMTGKTVPLCIFYNNNGTLETTPSFSAPFLGGRQMAVGDIDNDGYIDVAVATCGFEPLTIGYICIYKNNNGVLEDMPSWYCEYYNQPSCVEFADLNNDGYLDLIAGAWFAPFGVFENDGGTFPPVYSWVYNGASRPQQVAVADFDKDGLVDTSEVVTADGTLKLIYLQKNLQGVSSVEVNGAPLGLDAYCYNLLDGWVSLATAPDAGDEVTVNYTCSTDLDLAATCLEAVFVFENEGEDYRTPPTDIDILLLVDDNFGANFCMGNSLNIQEHFEAFGWNVVLASTKTTVSPCTYAQGQGCTAKTVDTLISQIDDVTGFDIISIMPGQSYPNLYNDPDVNSLLQAADENDIIISAWCRGPRLLASAGILDGVTMTGNSANKAEYIAAGADFLGAGIPPVVDGNIVTSTRSNYYRTLICETIVKALPPVISATTQFPEVPTSTDSVIITALITDNYNDIGLAVIYADLDGEFEPFNMYDDGNHHDGAAGDSVFGGVIPPKKGGEVRYYIYAEDDVTAYDTDPTDAPNVTYGYVMPSCCVELTGNADCAGPVEDPEEPDISDIVRIIDFLYISHDPLCCLEEADVDASGPSIPEDPFTAVDISDIVFLIDHLYISHKDLPVCP